MTTTSHTPGLKGQSMTIATLPTLITRKQYMDDTTLHHRYWLQFATESTRIFIRSRIGMDKLKASTDPYFNDIIKMPGCADAKWIWDFAPVDVEKMREAGECSPGYRPSLAAITCTTKACARDIMSDTFNSLEA